MQSQQIKDSTTNEQQNIIIKQIKTLPGSRIINYPYYPITHTITKNDLSYLFLLTCRQQQLIIKINCYHQNCSQFSPTQLHLSCLSQINSNHNYFYVLKYQDTINQQKKTIIATYLQFVIGYASGYLIRCIYTKNINQDDDDVNEQQEILGKFNKKPIDKDKKQWITKIQNFNKSFFSSEEFYKVAVNKPIRNFAHYPISTQKYHYSYLVGNRLYFCKQFTQQLQQQTIIKFQQAKSKMSEIVFCQKQKNGIIIINSKKMKALITANTMLIQWAYYIPCYTYTNTNQLILIDNQQNKILIYDIKQNLINKSVYNFDLGIKKINYFTSTFIDPSSKLLFIMPYENKLYILNLNQNTIVALNNHRSYISQCYLTKQGSVITGGCDRTICLWNMKDIDNWTTIQPTFNKQQNQHQYSLKQYSIVTSQVADSPEQSLIEQWNNTNEKKNNNQFGFGNFLPMGMQSKLYCFLAFDYYIKIYQILA